MKKILVVLLVLAVAGGVFAQEGEFSFSGTAQIGAAVDLDPLPGKDVVATSRPTQWNRLYDGWNGIKGQFGINYSRDGFGAGLTFESQYPGDGEGGNFQGNLNYGGENFNFQAQAPLDELIAWGGQSSFNALWGNYSFLDGIFFLEAAYVKTGSDFWVSDTTAAFRNWRGWDDNSPIAAGDHNTFTHTGDGREWGGADYIVGDIRLQGLSFGLMMRDIFRKVGEEDFTVLGYKVNAAVDRPFVEGVLKNMIFGLKFEFNPIEVAAQFLMRDYGVYLGGKWFVGPVTVGLSFMGILSPSIVDVKGYLTDLDDPYFTLGDPDKDGVYHLNGYAEGFKSESSDRGTRMKVGGSVNYGADGFGASINGFLAMDGNKTKGTNDKPGYKSEIGVEPGFFYDVIPTHLKFKLDTGFYFYTFYASSTQVTSGWNNVQFALTPQLFWNFLGTGAGEYGGTGIAIRYKLVGGDATKARVRGLNNKFDVNFKWSF